jgi:hypothetical protein
MLELLPLTHNIVASGHPLIHFRIVIDRKGGGCNDPCVALSSITSCNGFIRSYISLSTMVACID